jgi:peroxiredoxin
MQNFEKPAEDSPRPLSKSQSRAFLRNTILALIGLALFLLLYSRYLTYVETSKANSDIRVGTQAPELELSTFRGGKLNLKDLRGKPVILFFFSGTCSSCLQSAALWFSIKTHYSHRGLEFLGVSSSPREEIREFFNQTGLEFPVLMGDVEVMKRFDVSEFPTILLLDSTGKISFFSKNMPTDEGLSILNEQLDQKPGD